MSDDRRVDVLFVNLKINDQALKRSSVGHFPTQAKR